MATYTKEELYSITRRLYRLFKNHPEMFCLKKLRGHKGWYDHTKIVIELDYRTDILPTILHEAFHHWYPDWSETKVETAERNIINQCSIKQVKNIIKKFADVL